MRTITTPMLLPLLLAVAAFFSPLWGQTNASVLVIQGGTLIDGSGVPPVANAMIVIEDGHIRQIRSGGEMPPGAQVLNSSGKYIIPGLIDSHVHYDMPWLHRLYLANGVTSVRDLGGSIERLLTLRQEIASGDILAPRMFISGMPINPGSVKAMNLSSSREMAEKLVEAGVDGIKVTGYTPDELREIVEVAHAADLIVYGHTGPKRGNRGPGARLAIEAGLDGIEHALGVLEDAMDRDVPVPEDYDPSNRDHIFRHWYGRMHSVVDPDTVQTIVQMMVDNDVYFSPTLVNFNRNFVKRNTPETEANPRLKYIPEAEPSFFGRFGPSEREEWGKTMELMLDATFRFHQAGGFLIAGTDSPGAALPGWSLHQEMQFFVQAGISPMEALKAATLNNAKVINQDHLLGTLETGKYADLVILDADPLQDISNTEKIHRVIKNGMVLDPATLLEDNLRQFGNRGERHFDRTERN